MKTATVLVAAAALVSAIDVKVSSENGIKASPLQYGMMFEDINASGDGGIYAELLSNRAFQGDSLINATMDPWTCFGSGCSASMGKTDPALSEQLPNSIAIKGDAGKEIGISNPGYYGIDVLPQKYVGSFYSMGTYSSNFTAALRDANNGKIIASAVVPSSSVAGSWTKHEYTIESTVDAGTNIIFTLTYVNDPAVTLNFNLISLFPPTYNDQPNGMRKDLMQTLLDLKPSFFRVPGGNNIEGVTYGNEWKWQNTIGDMKNRAGRAGTWGYFNTDGLGLIEYMIWCQDLKVEPVLGFFAGLYLGGQQIAENDLQPYIDDVMHELEFLMGDASTEWGKKRIDLGHEEPFMVKYVEVGNEDMLNKGLETYNQYRFQRYYDAIIAVYPNMVIIGSTVELTTLPGNAAVDYHSYTTPDNAVKGFNMFDNQDPAHKVLIGEYAVVMPNHDGPDPPFVLHPFWEGGVGEAVFWLGTERNTDKVIGNAYAPLLQNVNHTQWTPDLITFSADQSSTTLSTSWYVYRLYSENRFTTVLPTTNDVDYNPAYWVAGLNEDTNTYLLKAAVYNTPDAQNFTLHFPGASSGAIAQLTVLTAPDGTSFNEIGSPNVVKEDKTDVVAGDDGAFTFTLPPLSVAVLKWTAGDAKRDVDAPANKKSPTTLLRMERSPQTTAAARV